MAREWKLPNHTDKNLFLLLLNDQTHFETLIDIRNGNWIYFWARWRLWQQQPSCRRSILTRKDAADSLPHPAHFDIRTWVMGKLGGWHGLHITWMSDLTNVISDGIGYI